MSFLPLAKSSVTLYNSFTILVGIIHGMRLVEFIFIANNRQWLAWLLNTYLLNVMGLYAFNYDEISEYIRKVQQTEE